MCLLQTPDVRLSDTSQPLKPFKPLENVIMKNTVVLCCAIPRARFHESQVECCKKIPVQLCGGFQIA